MILECTELRDRDETHFAVQHDEWESRGPEGGDERDRRGVHLLAQFEHEAGDAVVDELLSERAEFGVVGRPADARSAAAARRRRPHQRHCALSDNCTQRTGRSRASSTGEHLGQGARDIVVTEDLPDGGQHHVDRTALDDLFGLPPTCRRSDIDHSPRSL